MARRDKSMTKGSWSKDDLKELKKLFPNRPTADVARSRRGFPTTRWSIRLHSGPLGVLGGRGASAVDFCWLLRDQAGAS